MNKLDQKGFLGKRKIFDYGGVGAQPLKVLFLPASAQPPDGLRGQLKNSEPKVLKMNNFYLIKFNIWFNIF